MRHAARLFKSVRIFFTVGACFAAFFLWEGSPSVFHGHVVGTATGGRWVMVAAGYWMVILIAVLLWFGRVVPIPITDVRPRYRTNEG